MADGKLKTPNTDKTLIISISVTLIALLIAIAVNIKTDSSMYSLPSDCIVFKEEIFVNPNNPDDRYSKITFNGREYISYGKMKSGMTEEKFGQCVGYIERGYKNDTLDRIIVLSETDDFIAMYPIGNITGEPTLLRAKDTMKTEIKIPDYVQSLGYEIWK